MSSFTARVYEMVKKIPPGKVATYLQIASLAGNKHAFRAVGAAMSKNTHVDTIPCHRVVGSDGKLHGYVHGVARKASLLATEGVFIDGDTINLARYQWNGILVLPK